MAYRLLAHGTYLPCRWLLCLHLHTAHWPETDIFGIHLSVVHCWHTLVCVLQAGSPGVVQSLFALHWTQVLVVVLQASIPGVVQSAFTLHWTQVLFPVLQASIPGVVQSVFALHWTQVLLFALVIV